MGKGSYRSGLVNLRLAQWRFVRPKSRHRRQSAPFVAVDPFVACPVEKRICVCHRLQGCLYIPVLHTPWANEPKRPADVHTDVHTPLPKKGYIPLIKWLRNQGSKGV